MSAGVFVVVVVVVVVVLWRYVVGGMLQPNWSYISSVSTIVAESCVRRI